MAYTLTVKEINTKSARFHYQVKDENGTVISERKSDRTYQACTINGSNYFGRVDLADAFLNRVKKYLKPGKELPHIAYLVK